MEEKAFADPPFAALGETEILAPGGDVVVPADASPLEFLEAVYRDPRQPMVQRMRAAIEALPFTTPKLAVTASIDGGGLAERLERAIARSGKAVPMIEG